MIRASRDKSVADWTEGPILCPLIAFSVPIILTNVLQNLFNSADMAVVFRLAQARLDTLDAYRVLIGAFPVTWLFTAVVNTDIYFVVLRALRRTQMRL